MSVNEIRRDHRSTFLLVLAIILASVVVVWVIFYFQSQSREQSPVGQSTGIQKIMVVSFPVNIPVKQFPGTANI